MKKRIPLFLFTLLMTSLLGQAEASNFKKLYINLSKDGQQAQASDIPTYYNQIETKQKALIYDFGNFGNTGTFNGNSKVEEGTLVLNGGFVSTNQKFAAGPKTISAVITPSSLSTDYQGIVGEWWYGASGAGEQFNFGIYYDKLYLRVYSDATKVDKSIFASQSLIVNKTYHVAATLDTSGNAHLYLDGKDVGSLNGFPLDTINHLTPIRIGSWLAGSTQVYRAPFYGKMDNVSIWNVSRTPEEVVSEAKQGIKGNEKGLVSYWNFN